MPVPDAQHHVVPWVRVETPLGSQAVVHTIDVLLLLPPLLLQAHVRITCQTYATAVLTPLSTRMKLRTLDPRLLTDELTQAAASQEAAGSEAC